MMGKFPGNKVLFCFWFDELKKLQLNLSGVGVDIIIVLWGLKVRG
jgi:hypothetical protein